VAGPDSLQCDPFGCSVEEDGWKVETASESGKAVREVETDRGEVPDQVASWT
jgi:hypothetical protein